MFVLCYFAVVVAVVGPAGVVVVGDRGDRCGGDRAGGSGGDRGDGCGGDRGDCGDSAGAAFTAPRRVRAVTEEISQNEPVDKTILFICIVK